MPREWYYGTDELLKVTNFNRYVSTCTWGIRHARWLIWSVSSCSVNLYRAFFQWRVISLAFQLRFRQYFLDDILSSITTSSYLAALLHVSKHFVLGNVLFYHWWIQGILSCVIIGYCFSCSFSWVHWEEDEDSSYTPVLCNATVVCLMN